MDATNHTDEAVFKLASIIESSHDAIIGLDLKGIIRSWNPGAQELYGYTAKEAIGKPITITVPKGYQEQFWRGLAEIKRGGRVEYETRRIRKDGTLVDVWIIVSPIKDSEGKTVGISGIIRNIGERKRRENEAQLLKASTDAIREAQSLESALAAALREVCLLTGWALGQAWTPVPDKTALRCVAAWHRPGQNNTKELGQVSKNMLLAPGVGVIGRVWVSKNRDWIKDVSRHPGFVRVHSARKAGLKGYMAVPIIVKQEAVAIMEFWMKDPCANDEDYLELISSVAAGLGSYLERRSSEESRLVGRHLIDVAENERRTVARELHDSVNQILASAKYRVQALGAKLCDVQGSVDSNMVKAVGLLDQAMQEIRRISKNLQPVVLEELGLVSAVRSFCSEFGERTGTLVRVRHAGLNKRLPPNVEITLFRIVQEVFNNIERHSCAKMIKLEIRRRGVHLKLMIQDDGKGFHLKRSKNGGGKRNGLGLLNMRERAAHLGGYLEIFSTPGQGTKIMLEIPLQS